MVESSFPEDLFLNNAFKRRVRWEKTSCAFVVKTKFWLERNTTKWQ